MADPATDMRLYQTRLDTFGKEAHPSKKRRSSGGAITKSWPHETPTAQDLAFAGFYYNPTAKTEDNVNCFHCHVKLDGWEIDDIPIKEHLAHSPECAWAITTSVTLDGEDRDPMSDRLLKARIATFGNSWPYEKKRGWKCKSKKLAEAGWCMDPSMAGEDGTTCFYCNLSLDGWEPKDEPIEEHRKRQPDCAFFRLVERYAVSRPKKARARTSTASRTSRLSIQSTFSEAPSLMSLGDAGIEQDIDNSIATVTSTVSTTKGRKAAAAKKGGRGKKKAAAESESEQLENATAMDESLMPSQITFQDAQEEIVKEPSPEPAKKTTKGKGRGKKAAASQEEHKVEEFEPKPTPKSKRGKKRMSDGVEKVEVPVSEVEVQPDEEAAPVKGRKGKATKGKKAKVVAEELVEESISTEPVQPEPAATEETAKPKRGRKAKATKAAKAPTPEPEPEPVADVEMEESANFVVHGEDESEPNFVVHDESEPNVVVIEESEPNVVVHEESEANYVVHEVPEIDAGNSTPKIEEFEPSPTPQKAAASLAPPSPRPATASAASTPGSVRSHNSSNAENHVPSSIPPPSRKATAILAPISLSPPPAMNHAAPLTSPARTTRVPLAAQTPNRSPTRMSPHKLGTLKAAQPWTATDIETVFFPSAELGGGQENTSGAGVAQKLAELGGQLSSPEKRMTVEEWVRFQALKGEERLREECERMVWLFEREGTRALGVLGGIESSVG